ncbi:MAG TPA: PD-(D/E)XK nuclease domain-containing protein [Candidatus Mediterraneibacter faecavium]|uniref:PD-(D/E)XK nuclease domain-containing protein n=1 Tax=Candidatus Mediterraneibacter faecavium TaxID=2838668 RepID=A0A9D2TML4_9FIRM|nr:PD-(D/E)XK nuclease domain-containing protein [Candidatus Mediterraneibacter faecavium]
MSAWLVARGNKTIRQDLTYNDMYDSIDNVWSLLFTTGYLTQRGVTEQREYILAIPNKEIRNIFTEQILQWFQDTARKDGDALHTFCNAFKNGDNKTAEKKFNEYLRRTISIRDTAVRRDKKENYYHGILLGLLSFESSWDLASNRESGDGYCDIMAEIDTEGIGIVIELKYADNGDLDAACRKAMEQIDLKRYDEQLIDDGMETILKYGVACYKKRCRIILDKTIL